MSDASMRFSVQLPTCTEGLVNPIPFARPEDFKGIDILRTIRSFDPCMPCTTHMDTGKGVIVREVNSCGCTPE